MRLISSFPDDNDIIYFIRFISKESFEFQNLI